MKKDTASTAAPASHAIAVVHAVPPPDAQHPSGQHAPLLEDENVILKLTFGAGSGGDSSAYATPDPYNLFALSANDPSQLAFASQPCTLEPVEQHQDRAQNDDKKSVASASPNKATIARVVRLLAEFEEKSKSGEWPLSTSVHCYWCCHRFQTPPLGLPIKFSAGQYHVVGCFCSLECACAHNFATTRDSVDECLNRYSLINSLSARLGLDRVVKPAPDRLALSIFGGHMSIDEFRAYGQASGGRRQLVVSCPPMQSVTQQVEEVNEADLSSEYRYIPLDNDRVSRYQEKVRLSRTKPLVNYKNTLDHSMKLKYGSTAKAVSG